MNCKECNSNFILVNEKCITDNCKIFDGFNPYKCIECNDKS